MDYKMKTEAGLQIQDVLQPTRPTEELADWTIWQSADSFFLLCDDCLLGFHFIQTCLTEIEKPFASSRKESENRNFVPSLSLISMKWKEMAGEITKAINESKRRTWIPWTDVVCGLVNKATHLQGMRDIRQDSNLQLLVAEYQVIWCRRCFTWP